METVDGYGRDSYGEGFADVYDRWYTGVSDAGATARFVAARSSGPVVEFGSGTGRLAAPLAALGRAVIGIDASSAMLRRSRHHHPDIPVVRADMIEPPVANASVGAVLIGFNTLFNLPGRAAQRRCLAAAASVLRADGVVVVEAFVPTADDVAGDRVDVVRLETDRVVLRVSRVGADGSSVEGQHVDLRDGHPVRLRPWSVQFCSPEDLDAMAQSAGLTRSERFADWDGAQFDESSETHISVYRPTV